MVRKAAGRIPKGLPARNSRVALIGVRQRRQAGDGRGKIRGRMQEHIEINNKFGGETRDRGTPDVFDASGEVAERRGNSLAKGNEESWPARVVIQTHDGRRS